METFLVIVALTGSVIAFWLRRASGGAYRPDFDIHCAFRLGS